jgi:pyrrolysyl-tRNA synthetase-like protein
MDRRDSKSVQPSETLGLSAKKIPCKCENRGKKMAGKNVVAIVQKPTSKARQRFYRKNVVFFHLVRKLKLWPARSGVLHGVRTIEENGDTAVITTHCGETFTIRNSRTCRAARWLRNKWCIKACKKCAIPDWKLEKYTNTTMTHKWGAGL